METNSEVLQRPVFRAIESIFLFVGSRIVDFIGAETVWTRAQCVEFGTLLLERKHIHSVGGSYGFHDDKDHIYRFVEDLGTSL